MRIIAIMLAMLLLVTGISGCAYTKNDRDILYQTLTISSLQEGVFDGTTTVGDLKKYGDIGVGTFEGLDGEMIILDGVIYQVKGDGKIYLPSDDTRVPFAAITYFETDKKFHIDKDVNVTQLQQLLDKELPTSNVFYAIRIDGTFSHVKTRSVDKQSKPYPTLAKALENQKIFEFNNVKGTIVGLRCPSYIGGINVAGYHFHFITDDRKGGGHVLECQLQDADVKFDETAAFIMILSETGGFSKADLSGDKQAELNKIEK